ncbi:MAG: hypothetical protein COA78_12650 [Blastopirellula sp.]|nr:MAG: hypothetical protein COA78_12650 [Blastopirellula sp.]
MKQNELNRLIARSTGETVATIKHLGFYLEEPAEDQTFSETQVIDWDELAAERESLNWLGQHHEPVCT